MFDLRLGVFIKKVKFHYLAYNPIFWESHVSYFDISNCSTLRRTQKTEFCLKQPGISEVFPKNVAAKYSKIEEFRGRPRESFILEHLELSKTPKNNVGDQGTCVDQYSF